MMVDFNLSRNQQITKFKDHLIVDGFYEFPDRVRDAAFSKGFEYRSEAVSYPGAEGYVDAHDWLEIHGRVSQGLIHRHLQSGGEPPSAFTQHKKNFHQGKFRIATALDEIYRPDGVHQDFQRWTGVVYLTLPQHCAGGFELYSHSHTGALDANDPRYIEFLENMLAAVPVEMHDYVVHEHMRDKSNWTLIDEIPLAYNRFIIAMAHCFHATGVCFGSNIQSARLSQHFEFYDC